MLNKYYNALVFFPGYLFRKTICKPSGKGGCSTCREALIDSSGEPSDLHKLIDEKEYSPNALTRPSLAAYSYFSTVVTSTQKNEKIFKMGGEAVDVLVSALVEHGKESNMPECCLEKLTKRFLKCKRIFLARKLEAKRRKDRNDTADKNAGFASKSIAAKQLP